MQRMYGGMPATRKKSGPGRKTLKARGTASRSAQATRTGKGAKPADSAGGITPKVLAMLEALVSSPRPMSTPDLESACGLKTATAHRVLKMLHAMGLVERDAERRYHEGRRLTALSLATLAAAAQRLPRHLTLVNLAEEIGESCHFCVLSDGEALSIDRAERPDESGIRVGRGAGLPLHCSASGKLLLAFMPSPAREQTVAKLTLERRARATITSAEDLHAELQKIASRGFAIDDEEVFDGIVALSVPVRNRDGKLIGALTAAMPKMRWPDDALRTLLPRLRNAAELLGKTY
jgi:DNA-binding IclR family transcriptional regulator